MLSKSGCTANLLVAATNVPREDVQSLHPDIPWSRQSGFLHSLSALKLPPHDFELTVNLLWRWESYRAATIIGARGTTYLPASHFQPIAVTTLARTGSTWLLALLSQHPEIIAFRPLEAEPKVFHYWTDILGDLSEPRATA